MPRAFAAVAVLTVAGVYGVQLCGARVRLGLLRWGWVARVIDIEKRSSATYFNAWLPMAHGWTVTRQRWSGPNTTTKVSYARDGHRGELVVRGREYVDGVRLADGRNRARARCVTAFTYDLDRDQTGNWVGTLRPRLRAGMACWLQIVIGWLAPAGVAATGFPADLAADGPPENVPNAGTWQVSGKSRNHRPGSGPVAEHIERIGRQAFRSRASWGAAVAALVGTRAPAAAPVLAAALSVSPVGATSSMGVAAGWID